MVAILVEELRSYEVPYNFEELRSYEYPITIPLASLAGYNFMKGERQCI